MLENIIKHSYFTVILSIFAFIFITGCENDNDKIDFPSVTYQVTHEDIGMMQRLDINPALEVLKK